MLLQSTVPTKLVWVAISVVSSSSSVSTLSEEVKKEPTLCNLLVIILYFCELNVFDEMQRCIHRRKMVLLGVLGDWETEHEMESVEDEACGSESCFCLGLWYLEMLPF